MNSVYRRTIGAALSAAALLLALVPCSVSAQPDPILEARDALRRRDAGRLAMARASAMAQKHPLAMWADYWELQNRLAQASPEELTAFFARWPDTYVEDRLRNDWLLELGRRNDWATFAAEHPKFRMQDDKEVACYAVLAQRETLDNLRSVARRAWLAQREADQGCGLMASTLLQSGVLSEADIWRKARRATDAGRRATARQAVAVLGPEAAQRFDDLYDNAARYLARRAGTRDRTDAELTTLALVRLAAGDPEVAAEQLDAAWASRLPEDLAAWAWASTGRQAALRLSPRAPDFYQRATLGARESDWSEDMLAWKARAALRAGRWQQVVQAINAMSEADQADATWVYWKGRALLALSRDSQDSEKLQTEAVDLLSGIADQHDYYGRLAAEDMGRPLVLPQPPAPLTEAEQAAARRNPGLGRALQLIGMGLRSEGVREWNWTLSFGSQGRMTDRELLAAAQLACDREVWDRCINTSDRTRDEFQIEQRFPMPFRAEVLAKSRDIGLDPAYVYGLIRQESRFVMDARSHVGASGLMQLMPATARWTARRLGLNFTPDMITDRNVNLALGTNYLKLVLDDLGGSQAMGAAAYNAGPGRPRRWREGPVVEAPIWVENIPFSETRDYVKKVLANATYYAAQITGELPSLKLRLGGPIGPRDALAPPAQTDLP
nr:lytic transglycosylase domain-containing protein [Caldimonas brevitalea]